MALCGACAFQKRHRARAFYVCHGKFPGIGSIEAQKGNEPARRLYEGLGFEVRGIIHGRMPGNETFEVDVYDLRKKD